MTATLDPRAAATGPTPTPTTAAARTPGASATTPPASPPSGAPPSLAPRGLPGGWIEQLRGLARGLVRHRATLIETGRAIFASAGGRDPAAVDPSALGRARLAVRPEPAHVRRFVEVTGGAAAWYERPSGAGSAGAEPSLLLPPTYASTWGMRLLARLIAEARLALPLARVLHVGNAVRFERWPLAGEPLDIEARVASIDAKPSRTIVVGRIEHRTPAGDPLFVVDMTAFFPGAREDGSAKGSKAKGEGKEPPSGAKAVAPAPAAERAEVDRVPFGARELGRFVPTMALTRAYTAVSGDFNPVHVSDLAAKLLGFPRAFIHGYATKALALSAVIGGLCGGDPTRLRAAEVRFRRPLLLGVDAGVYAGEPAAAPAGDETAWPIAVGPGPGEAAHVSGVVVTR